MKSRVPHVMLTHWTFLAAVGFSDLCDFVRPWCDTVTSGDDLRNEVACRSSLQSHRTHVVGSHLCTLQNWRFWEGGGDVKGVVAPLRGVAQVGLHGDQVVELSVLLGVHQERGLEEDGRSRKGGSRGQGETLMCDGMRMG